MVVVGLADIHGAVTAVGPALDGTGPVDLVLLLGDLTHFGGEEAAEQIVQAVRPRVPRLLAVPGNCDTPEAAAYLEKEELSLHRRGVVVERIGFIGVGKSLPCPGRTPGEASEEEFKTWLEEGRASVPADIPTVLVTHQPPSQTLCDRVRIGRHVGSTALRRFIQKTQPLVCFTGHIHEGVGIDTIGGTRVANPGPLRDERYVYAEFSDGLKRLEIRKIRE